MLSYKHIYRAHLVHTQASPALGLHKGHLKVDLLKAGFLKVLRSEGTVSLNLKDCFALGQKDCRTIQNM